MVSANCLIHLYIYIYYSIIRNKNETSIITGVLISP